MNIKFPISWNIKLTTSPLHHFTSLGIVQRQGLRNTFISYAGLGLGFVNTVLVLPKILEPQQIGLTGVLAAIATMLAQIAAFGFGNMGVRFFPISASPKPGTKASCRFC